jgi:HK97 gp10 family phage protein
VSRIRLNPSEMRAVMGSFADRDAKRVAEQVQARAKVLAPVDTGRLRASIKIQRKLTFRGPTYTVYTNVKYAPYVEQGTRPHVIRPKTKKALKFKMGGRTVFATVVNHPGTRPQPFLGRAVREVGIRNGYEVRITE